MNLDDPLLDISLHLHALGLAPPMKDINDLKKKFGMKRRTPFVSTRKLRELKKDIAQLECYKKKTKDLGIGYYDSYRNMCSQWDHDADGYKKKLTLNLEKMVDEAEMKPQKEGAQLRNCWLFEGTNYRRMVEPLIIAEYYREGGRDYEKRPKHLEKLEKWLREGNPTTTDKVNSTSKHNVESMLTLDSCFWAYVEEALISCKEFKEEKNEEARNKLLKFEEYVYELLKKYACRPYVTPL